METVLIIINVVILIALYRGVVEMLVHLGYARSEARLWLVEAFCRGIGRMFGDPPEDEWPQNMAQ